MAELQDQVVASLPNKTAHPYSSVAMSHDRQYAIVAGKDTLTLVQVSPKGPQERQWLLLVLEPLEPQDETCDNR